MCCTCKQRKNLLAPSTFSLSSFLLDLVEVQMTIKNTTYNAIQSLEGLQYLSVYSISISKFGSIKTIRASHAPTTYILLIASVLLETLFLK